MPPILSPGKVRNLQACVTSQGMFAILAVDHRDSLRAIIAPEAPRTVTAGQLTEIKLAIVKHLSPLASAILLDPVYSMGQSILGGQLSGHTGLLCALEEQGYLGDPFNRRTPMLAGWSIEKTRRLGANGVKLLLFYHPDAGAATEEQERLVAAVAADCIRYEVPLFLEPITYSPDADIQKGSPQFARLRRQIIVESARRLSAIGPDVLKVEFPIDVCYESDQAVWAEACAELNAASLIPWTLLSAGDSFETFKKQLRVACQAGCSGFVGGRAIWQEVVQLPREERADFLANVAHRRLAELTDIAIQYGVPWSTRYSESQVDEHWFRGY
jgi:tagatose 1,6-diphosphate aldolase